jgi:osmotically-inducible protein OsmY
MMNFQLLKTVGLVILIGKLIAGCALERKLETPEDARITADVRGLLDQHRDLGPPNSIDVSTFERVVYLSGLVSTGLEGREAEEIARQAPGVARVVNSVAVVN